MVVQDSGKIVVGGRAFSLCSPPGFFGAFARLNADGSLDSSFGNAGRTILSFQSVVSRIALQPDGKIVGAGVKRELIAGDDVLVLRLDANGFLDSSFGAGTGFVTNHFFADDGALAVALQPDGKIVVAGFRERNGTLNDWAVLRYDSSGSLDTPFAGTGYVITDMGGCCTGGDFANAVAVQSDGKIVVGGRGFPVSRMARYLPGGQLDSSFGSGGRLNVPAPDEVLDVDLQFNGKIVTTARLSFVGRFLENGALDTSFGNNGQVNPVPPGFVKRTLIEPSGRIIVAFVSPVGLAACEGDPVPPSPTPTPTATATHTVSATPTPTEASMPTPVGPATTCPAEPRAGCDAPRRSKLVIRNGLDDARDSIELLLWRGRRRQASSAFGNPLATTNTLVCVYDNAGLVLELAVPPGPRWSPVGQRGFLYADPAGSVAGIQRFSLERRAGWLVRHETTIRLQAEGANVPEMSLPLSEPVTVQVLNDATDVCFGDTFTGEHVRTNASLIFRGLRR